MKDKETTKPLYNTTITSDWQVKTLGEVATFINGKAYKQKELLSEGKYKVLRVGNFFTRGDWYYSDLELEDDKYVFDGDLMYAWSASFGPRYWRGEKTIYHYHIWKVIPSELITKQFLFFHLLFDTEKIFSNKQGGTMFHITKGDMEKRKINLPPVPEQKVIAHLLGLIDSIINQNNQLIARKELRKKWLMQNLLTGKKRLKGFEKIWGVHKTDFGLKIPRDWGIVNVEDVFMERNEKSNDQNKYPLYSLTIETGLTEKTDRYERSFLLKDQENNQYKIVCPNDILFNPMNLRFGAIAKSNINFKVLVSAYYNAIHKSKESIDINYYERLFKTRAYNSFYERIAIGSLIEKKRVHLSNFLKLQIPLPSLEEQTAIAQVLQAADKEIQLLKTKTEKLREQKKGMMQVLLTGKKRLKIN